MHFFTDCISLDPYTTAELNAMIPDTQAGTIAFNSDLNAPVFFDGTAWKQIQLI